MYRPDTCPDIKRALLVTSLAGALLVGCTQGSENIPHQTEITSSTIQEPQTDTVSTTPADILSRIKNGEFSTNPTWEQDFSTMASGGINTNVWRYDLDPAVPGYNDEQQAYTNNPENVRIENGTLVIEARKQPTSYLGTDAVYEYSSGRIDTKDSFTFTYGRIEATMKVPTGEGVWPAFWLLSANQPNTQGATNEQWAEERFYLKDGELDIVEFYGDTLAEGSVHTYNNSVSGSTNVPDATTTFHTYAVEVTPEGIKWFVDDNEYYSVTRPEGGSNAWPFTEENNLYVIVNVAMGGEGVGPIDQAIESARLEVSSIRFYDYTKTLR